MSHADCPVLFSTLNRGMLDLGMLDIRETLAGNAVLLDPQPFKEGKLFYHLCCDGDESVKAGTKRKAPGTDDAFLLEGIRKTEQLHCVERTFACLGFRAFNEPPERGYWSSERASQIISDLVKEERWSRGLQTWALARNWNRTREEQPTFRVSLRFRGSGSKQPSLYAALTAAISSVVLAIPSALPPSTLPWQTALENYDLELWVHINDEGIVLGIPLRRGRNVYSKGAEKGGLRDSAAWGLARIGLNACPDALIAVDPCAGIGTVLAKLREMLPRVFAIAGDVDLVALRAAKLRLGKDSDFVLWDFTRPPLRPGVVDLLVSDLPFGVQHRLDADLYRALSVSFENCLSGQGRIALLCNSAKSQELIRGKFKLEKEVPTRIGNIETSILVLGKEE